MASSGSSVIADYEAVLFDLDGVMTPTADVHRRAWREVFEDVLPRLAEGDQTTYRDDDYELHIDGRPRFEGVERLLRAHGVDLEWGDPSDPPGDDTVCAIGNRKNASFNELLGRETLQPYPGSVALLKRIREAGLRTAIVSSSANAKAVLVSAGLEGVFDVVVDGVVIAGRGLAGKPQPDPFLEAARLLDAPPDRAVVVEDAIAGVEAGAAGGFGLVVGVALDTDPDRLREA
ncbi:MAG: HAD-IA family hydrolase, partial [Acidimicrobiia bacterium]